MGDACKMKEFTNAIRTAAKVRTAAPLAAAKAAHAKAAKSESQKHNLQRICAKCHEGWRVKDLHYQFGNLRDKFLEETNKLLAKTDYKIKLGRRRLTVLEKHLGESKLTK